MKRITPPGRRRRPVHVALRPRRRPPEHEVLDLDLNPINLDVLGALVQTSSICLNVTAARGPGNLLGNRLA
ncbi:MAG: hypothetical protein ACYC61_23840 [Isosphaeraceae bacterium]